VHVNVPQFVDIEDKIAFGLTAKQLLWMAGMTAALIVVYSLFDRQAFYLIGIFIVIIFGGFAFWKPQGLTLLSFSSYVIQFYMKPRNYIWRRVFHTGDAAAQRAAHNVQMRRTQHHTETKKPLTQDQLKRIAWMLDTKK
jgi:PrgI family protein